MTTPPPSFAPSDKSRPFPPANKTGTGSLPPGSSSTGVIAIAADHHAQAVNDVLERHLPWMTSLLVHLAIALLTLAIVFLTIKTEDPAGPSLIPTISNFKPTGPVVLPTDTPANSTSSPANNPTTQQTTQPTVTNTSPVENSIIGASPATPPGAIGPIKGERSPGIFDAGPSGGPAARRIVYIIDASGSLITDFHFVINQLKDSIHKLNQNQEFTVLFFQQDRAIEAGAPGLKRATIETKTFISNWVTPGNGLIRPYGTSNPLAALKLALGYKPDSIFILSDNITGAGQYEVDRSELLTVLNKLDPKRNTAIHTIQFLYPDQLGTLKAIADDHRGQFRFITRADLGLE